jgi:hypothetical protein
LAQHRNLEQGHCHPDGTLDAAARRTTLKPRRASISQLTRGQVVMLCVWVCRVTQSLRA